MAASETTARLLTFACEAFSPDLIDCVGITRVLRASLLSGWPRLLSNGVHYHDRRNSSQWRTRNNLRL